MERLNFSVSVEVKILSLLFGSFMFISQSSFSQTVTGACGAGQCQSVSSFTYCTSEGYYKATMTSTTWDATKLTIKVDGTDVKCDGYSLTGASYTADWIGSCSMSGLFIQASPAATYYIKVNTSTKNVQLTTSDFGCTTCTNASISVHPNTSNVSTCLNGTAFSALSVTAAGSATLSYQWQSSSTSGGTYTNISGATSSSYTPPNNVAGTKYYRCVVTSSCNGSTATSNVSGARTVRSAFTAGTINTTGETICYAGTPSAIGSTTVASGGDGTITYSWRSSADGYTAAISGATSSTYTPPAGLTSTTSYRRYAKDNTCNTTPTVATGTWTVTVRSNLTSGSIGSAQTICYNSTPSSLTNSSSPSGGTGSYTYQWQNSSDNSAWSNTSGATSSTYAPGALTSSTYYRRAATSGSCGTVYTSSVLLTVYPNLTPGSIGSAQTISENSTPNSFTSSSSPSGGTGSYDYQWQISSDSISWSNISGATSSTYAPGALTSSTYFSRAVTSGSCGTVKTSGILITVNTTLPVMLLYFKANEVNDGVLLSWETGMEINNDYFILEKSIDGLNWFQIAIVPGAGNSVLPISYTQMDTQGCQGYCYYRLTQVDFDGQTERFKKSLISSKEINENFSINVNPNPIQNNTEINFEVPENGIYNFKIVSTIGQIIFEKNIEALKGKGKLYFDSSQLSKGMYFFMLQNKDGDFKQQKVLK